MKAKVIETGEIVDVYSLYTPVYSRLDCNGKIVEEYDADELEFLHTESKRKFVPIDDVCNWLQDNLKCDTDVDEYGNMSLIGSCWVSNKFDTIQDLVDGLRKEFE